MWRSCKVKCTKRLRKKDLCVTLNLYWGTCHYRSGATKEWIGIPNNKSTKVIQHSSDSREQSWAQCQTFDELFSSFVKGLNPEVFKFLKVG